MGVVEDARFEGIDLSPWGAFDTATDTAYPLLFRMLDCAAMAREVWERTLTAAQQRLVGEGMGLAPEQAGAVVAFLAGLQDVGRLVPRVQREQPAGWARLGEELVSQAGREGAWVDPARLSMHVALGLLAQRGYGCAGNDSPAVRAAQVVGGCRGFFLQLDVDGAAAPARVAASAGGEAWQSLRRRYAALVAYLAGARQAPLRLSQLAAVLAAGVGAVAGQLAGQRRYWLQGADLPAFGAAEHYAWACEQAALVAQAAGLQRLEWHDLSFAAAHPQAAGPTALQKSLMQQLPELAGRFGSGLLLIGDATGSGKSIGALEAARILNAACGSEGVAWLAPTTATADAGWELLEKYVRRHEPPYSPVTLMHSYSRLNTAYTGRHLIPDEVVDGATGQAAPSGGPHAAEAGAGPEGGARGTGERDVTSPPRWLADHDVALLAPFTAATIDQAQMAALPVQFNAVRLLALSSKTVVVDEAHALSPFSHLQLLRLLGWLGALRTPVVLLSATLPASTAGELVRAYLAGAGHPATALRTRSFDVPYPGWLFAAAATAKTHAMREEERAAHRAAQYRQTRIRQHDVVRARLGEEPRTIPDGERLATITRLLQPVIQHGGCATVHCATVPDAQDTYRHLRQAWPGAPADLLLLHARFPGYVRERRTQRVRRLLGPSGQRPARLVVVTTSLLDTSVDIDVDVMISDLASVARLLQRMGRLARFAHRWQHIPSRRPDWWDETVPPHLHVLRPVSAAGATAIPAGWRTLEPAFLLWATADLLRTRSLITLPDEVQEMVEQIHGAHSPFAEATSDLRREAAQYRESEGTERALSAQHLIPPPARVFSLADLHRQRLTSAQAATRLGALPARLLPCYRTGAALTLDRSGHVPLPLESTPDADSVRRILQHALPVPAAWVARRSPRHLPPHAWRQHPVLADLVLLPAPAHVPGHLEQFGRHHLRMDDELGLVHTTTP